MNTTNSQAASINTPEFRQLLKDYSFYGIERGTPPLIAHIDAKLAQAKLRGMELANEKVFQPDMDEWKARAEKAESRLAEIQRGVEGLHEFMRSSFTGHQSMREEGFVEGWYPRIRGILALLQPQGQAVREVKSAPVEGNITREEARAAVIAVMKENEEFDRQCFHQTLTSDPSEEAKAFYARMDYAKHEYSSWQFTSLAYRAFCAGCAYCLHGECSFAISKHEFINDFDD